ncbi:MAG: hypothetical protein CPDRYMAC_1739 [uncultured Paraburkholderia sp.]|nr:MAG: hypothetical protein CPDRYDRY_1800 [uncultured Paraburkholderia sp.]CAH2920580.1 MAG: hypothetical protein CPDRYMAC_1739 [uncultured Paraburkholderia sp.]
MRACKHSLWVRAKALKSSPFNARGSSLLEVMLSVALMAVTVLGLLAGQLWTAREARATAMREHAAWIADSLAEAMSAISATSGGDAALRQWSARVSTLLPHGQALIADSGGISLARVSWTALSAMLRTDDMIDRPESCGGADLPFGSTCVVLAFLKWTGRQRYSRAQKLLEFVIGLALGLIVTAGTVSLYNTQRAAFDRASDTQRIREAGLTALTLMGQQIQMAGFVPADSNAYLVPLSLFGCSGGCPTGADDSLTCESLSSRSDVWRSVTWAMSCRRGRPLLRKSPIASGRPLRMAVRRCPTRLRRS